MRKYEGIAVSKFKPPANDPRVTRNPAIVQAMADSLRTLGLQCPVIAYRDAGFYILLDGVTRWYAAQLAGLTELEALILDRRCSKVI